MNAGISEARQLSAESITDRKTFENKISEAIKESKGNVAKAAEILGVSRRTMCRYIADNRVFGDLVDSERSKSTHQGAAGESNTEAREYNRRKQREWRAEQRKETRRRSRAR